MPQNDVSGSLEVPKVVPLPPLPPEIDRTPLPGEISVTDIANTDVIPPQEVWSRSTGRFTAPVEPGFDVEAWQKEEVAQILARITLADTEPPPGTAAEKAETRAWATAELAQIVDASGLFTLGEFTPPVFAPDELAGLVWEEVTKRKPSPRKRTQKTGEVA